MNTLESKIKKRYILFISTIIVIIIAVLLILQNSINHQKEDALLINKSGKQRMLSQSITKMVFSIENNLDETLKSNALKSLKVFTDELENSHNELYSNNKQKENNTTIDSLLKTGEPYLKKIITTSRRIISNTDSSLIRPDIKVIAEAEASYLLTMEAVVSEYQKASEENLQSLLKTFYFLVLIAALILIGEFMFILVPVLREVLQQNKRLKFINNKLVKSENKIKDNLLELTKLKTDLDVKEAYNRIFIEQAPMAIAMVDNNMQYIAVSQRWISDYNMEGQEFIGRSHYDLFPEIGDSWKAMHQRCLNGAIDINNEEPFVRTDGSLQWITWDVRPWYNLEGEIGGILMQTGDITQIKEKEGERLRIEKILERTNEIARIGTWDVDFVKNTVFWSKVVFEIHEVPEDFVPNLETAINFFKEGKSRNTIEKAINNAIEYGTSYDVEIELITAKGNILWTRAIGQAEIVNGKCIRLFGVFQDINDKKLSQLALNKAHTELKTIFNSGSIAIVSTEVDGIINQFNRGAEILTGYSASEMVGLQRPTAFHLREELDEFRMDMAKQYGKSPVGFSAQKEMSKHDAYDTREWHYLRKDGSTLPIQLTLTSMKDEQGKLIGFLGIGVDISERRSAENELLRKNHLLSFAEKITMMGNWQWDLLTNNVKWSANLYNIFEVEGNTAITYDTYFSFVHPEDKDRVTEHVEKSLIDKNFIDLTHRIMLINGTVKTIQLLAEIIINDSGELIEMLGTCQDVTAQRMAENKFRGLLESAPDAMVIVNERGNIQLINKQSEKLFGYLADELFGKSVETLIPKRFINNHTEFRDDFFTNPKTRGMGQGKELYGIHKNGNEIPIQISLSPLQTEEGLLVSAAIRDITQQKLAESRLIQSKEELEALANKLTNQNTQLADFAHITSHNLRAPVSNLNALLDFYNESESEEDKLILFQKFEKVTLHLTQTLNTLVEAIKTKNTDSQDIEENSFDDVLSITKEILYAKIVNSGAIITSDFSKIEKIKYNKIYLESIFLNLLSNAIKYRSESRIPEIVFASEIVDGRIKLKVIDNGMGIDLERHGRKLFGLNKVFHRHPDAQGVGLFITKAQIEAMGGTITASSEVNVGTTFYINF